MNSHSPSYQYYNSYEREGQSVRYTGQLLQKTGEEQPYLEVHSVEQKVWRRKRGIRPYFALLNA